MFFGFDSEAQARQMLPRTFDEIVAKGVKTTKRRRVCRRDRGKCLGWAPGDRFRYDDGGEPDDGVIHVFTTITYKGNDYAWSEPEEAA